MVMQEGCVLGEESCQDPTVMMVPAGEEEEGGAPVAQIWIARTNKSKDMTRIKLGFHFCVPPILPLLPFYTTRT
jgi:hypothetical protein